MAKTSAASVPSLFNSELSIQMFALSFHVLLQSLEGSIGELDNSNQQHQVFKNSERQVNWVTKFCTVALIFVGILP